jgi:hypothetical protein
MNPQIQINMNTTYDYQHVIESIVDAKLYGAPTTGTYKPTVVIGLGGTGVTTLRYLKRDLSMHEARHVRLLALDSNAAENTRFLSQLPSLEPDRELRILDQAAALRMLANATTGNGNRHVLQYLPKEAGRHKGIHEEVIAKINGQKGAGQFRRAGKLLFQANARSGANLNDTLAKLRDEMVGLRTLIEHQAAGLTLDVGVQVFVVCSAAGGQGAGCLLDCLALLRSHFNGPHDVITVICVLPGPLFHKVVKTRSRRGLSCERTRWHCCANCRPQNRAISATTSSFLIRIYVSRRARCRCSTTSSWWIMQATG